MPAWFLTGDRDGAVLSPASSSSFISGAVHCVKPEETANPNRMFVFAEKHPASVTLTNAVFLARMLCLKFLCSLTYNSHS